MNMHKLVLAAMIAFSFAVMPLTHAAESCCDGKGCDKDKKETKITLGDCDKSKDCDKNKDKGCDKDKKKEGEK